MGAPVSTRLERWAMARSVVAGRFVNAYSRRDWVLGLIYCGANGETPQPTAPSQSLCNCVSRCNVLWHVAAAAILTDLARAPADLLLKSWHFVKPCQSSEMSRFPFFKGSASQL